MGGIFDNFIKIKIILDLICLGKIKVIKMLFS